jgi:hypothetical protein
MCRDDGQIRLRGGDGDLPLHIDLAGGCDVLRVFRLHAPGPRGWCEERHSNRQRRRKRVLRRKRLAGETPRTVERRVHTRDTNGQERGRTRLLQQAFCAKDVRRGRNDRRVAVHRPLHRIIERHPFRHDQ